MKNVNKKIWFCVLLSLIFLTSCGNNATENIDKNETKQQIEMKNTYKKIADIPEASGICHMKSSDTFFVANDEWAIYEINISGKILQQKQIWDYDFEGISCDQENNEIALLLENNGNILKISPKNLEVVTELEPNLKKKDLKKYFNKKSGAEGLIFANGKVFISTQNDKNNLLEFSINTEKNELDLEKVYDIPFNDLSGLTFYKEELFILSDKNDSIWIYNLEKEKITKTLELEGGNWEWITHDAQGNIFLADDVGAIFQYKK